MPIPVICACGAKLRVKDELKGKQIKCPQCAALCTVGAAAAAPAAGKPAAAPPDRARILAESGYSQEEVARLEKELRKDEVLIWAAKPETKLPFFVGVGIASALFFGAGVLILINVLGRQSPGNDVVSIVLLALGGLIIAGGMLLPFLMRRRYRKTAYALTSKRALAWDGRMLGRTRFHDYDAADLAHMGHQDFSFGAASGVGHLMFATEMKRTREGSYVSRWHGFFYIRHFAEVERMIRKHLLESYLDKLYE
ncbi:MAG: hypothetical protein AB7K24_08680 [Gemmataceae bacterium]